MSEKLSLLDVRYTEGDRLPPLIGTLKESDFAGATVTLTIRRPTTVLVKTAVVTDGEFSVEWADDDLVAGIGQEALVRVTLLSGEKMTLLRFLIDIGEEIA